MQTTFSDEEEMIKVATRKQTQAYAADMLAFLTKNPTQKTS